MSAAMAAALQRQLKGARKHLQVLAESSCLMSPMGYLKQRRETLDNTSNRLIAAQNRMLSFRRQNFVALTAKLDAMSPLKVLTRGYAMTQTDDGRVVRSTKQVSSGDSIQITLSDGRLHATVTDIKENGL
jgi:exodeoxyribonuclease VII large subunit